MGHRARWQAVVTHILLASCFAVVLVPRDAYAISKKEERKCIADAIAATLDKKEKPLQEALTIAACVAAYKLEQKQASISPIGQSLLDGVVPVEFLGPGSKSTLTFEFIDTTTGLPVSAPSVGSVLYEESSTPDVPASFAPLGSSTDVLHNFPFVFTATDTEVDILAIPFDPAGTPIVILGVDGINVAEGDVVQLNAVPEPSTFALVAVGTLGLLTLRRVFTRRRVNQRRCGMIRLLVFLFTIGWIFGIPHLASASLLSVTVTVDEEQVLSVIGSGSAVTQDVVTHAHQPGDGAFITASGFWAIDFTVDEIDRQGLFDPDDLLTISGTIQHIKSPTGHGDGPGLPIPFRLFVNADFQNNGDNSATAMVTLSKVHGVHPPKDHMDNLTAFLNANTTFNIRFDDITSYNFNIDVRHCDDCPIATSTANEPVPFEVPEPSAWLMFGTGLMGLLGYGWRQRRKAA